jgi:hypothetical protein
MKLIIRSCAFSFLFENFDFFLDPSPHPGQTNPSGQRRSKRYFAHAASVAKRLWNSINDFGNRLSDPDMGPTC